MQLNLSGPERAKKHEQERAYRQHRERLGTQKPLVDNSVPASCAFVPHRSQRENIRRAQNIDRENRVLIDRMVGIMESKGSIDNSEPWRHTNKAANSRRVRQMREDDMARENAHLLTRLTNAKSSYDTNKLAADRAQNEVLIHRISRYKPVPPPQTHKSARSTQHRAVDENS